MKEKIAEPTLSESLCHRLRAEADVPPLGSLRSCPGERPGRAAAVTGRQSAPGLLSR